MSHTHTHYIHHNQRLRDLQHIWDRYLQSPSINLTKKLIADDVNEEITNVGDVEAPEGLFSRVRHLIARGWGCIQATNNNAVLVRLDKMQQFEGKSTGSVRT